MAQEAPSRILQMLICTVDKFSFIFSGMPPGREIASKTFRVVVMGTAGVGKTAIINQFIKQEFSENHKETVEELHHHCLNIDGSKLDIDILDTSGSFQFPAMRKLAIATGDAFVLVYSVDNPDSFETVKELREEIKEHKPKGKYNILVVGNKTDLVDTEHPNQAVIESVVCMDWEEKYFSTSAKDNSNISEIFKKLGSLCAAKKELEDKRLTLLRRTSMPTMKIFARQKSKTQLKVLPRTHSVDE